MGNVSPILSDYAKWLKAQHLTEEQATTCGFRYSSASEVSLVLGFAVRNSGVILPYPGTDYFRVRMLGDINPGYKYLSQRDSGCSPPYYADILGRDWKDIIADPSEPIVITEGELKAICGCKTGVPTLGLGGVEMQATLLTSGIVWSGRLVNICFDHDPGQEAGAYKPGVFNALGRLCEKLIQQGAKVNVIHLGKIVGLDLEKKWGLDDALQHGIGWPDILGTLGDPPQWCNVLAGLLDECVFVTGTNHAHVYNLKNHSRKSPSDFHDTHIEKKKWVLSTNGKSKAEQVSRTWIEHPGRVTVQNYDMNPRLPFGVQGDKMNLWQGYPVFKGSSVGVRAEWQKFMEGLFGEYWEWVGLWTGHMLNAPWERTNQAVMLVTQVQGIGKSLYGDVLRDLTGVHGLEGKASAMFGNFNSDMEAKTFVMVNELDVKFSAREGALNDLLTEEVVRVEQKGKDVILLPNLRRWYLTTNTSSLARLSKGQRRVLVINPPRVVGDTRGEWGTWVDKVIAGFRKSDAALAEIRGWFDDLWQEKGEGWNSCAPVPRTIAADEAAEASMTVNQIMAQDLFEVIQSCEGQWAAVHPDLKKLNVKAWGDLTAMVKAHGGFVGAKMVKDEGTPKQYTVFDMSGALERTKRNDGGHWMIIEMQAARDSAKHMAERYRAIEEHLTGKRD